MMITIAIINDDRNDDDRDDDESKKNTRRICPQKKGTIWQSFMKHETSRLNRVGSREEDLGRLWPATGKRSRITMVENSHPALMI